MHAIITASGIQEYIFDITQAAASARLRGRSARLGLVLDLCHQRLSEKFGGHFTVVRNAGSRLEIEFGGEVATPDVRAFIHELQALLDNHSYEELDGQVWFSSAVAESGSQCYAELAKQKLRPGRAVLQEHGVWNESAFTLERRTDERRLQREREEARELPEAVLGRKLAHRDNQFLQFTKLEAGPARIPILDSSVHVTRDDPRGYRFTLRHGSGASAKTHDPQLIHKRLCRYAPTDKDDNLLDLNEIAGRSTGASFLGVLKADLDNASDAFNLLPNDNDRRQLSERLEVFFTEDLEDLLTGKDKSGRQPYSDCYVVYSGGDDLFMLGPWDQLIRFAFAFQSRLWTAAQSWNAAHLTLSAAFKLSHPRSPVRHLAEEVEASLEEAKGRIKRRSATRLPAKNRLAVFERLLAWEEVGHGIQWAEDLIGAGHAQQLSRAFLQRLQYHAFEARRFFEDGKLEALRFVPLLHNDWERNKDGFGKGMAQRIELEVLPLLKNLGEKGGRMWRIMDFASRFAIYALRAEKKGEEDYGQRI